MVSAILGLLGNLLNSNQGGQDEFSQGMDALTQGVGQYQQPQGNYDIQSKPNFGASQPSMFGNNQNLGNETQKIMERLAQRYGGGFSGGM